jgi:hypothetical protein
MQGLGCCEPDKKICDLEVNYCCPPPQQGFEMEGGGVPLPAASYIAFYLCRSPSHLSHVFVVKVVILTGGRNTY